MGDSYIWFSGHDFNATDGPIEIWLLLLVEQIDRLSGVPGWLKDARDHWLRQATVESGYGVYPNLDEIVTDEGRRLTLISISQHALQDLRRHGDIVKKDDLNRLSQEYLGGLYKENVSTPIILRIGE